MARNPFLPKKAFRWRTGPSAGTIGLPQAQATFASAAHQIEHSEGAHLKIAYRKDPRGRKPKDISLVPPAKTVSNDLHEQVPTRRMYPHAGKLSLCTDLFFCESSSGWGSSLDMMALANGPVGCGAFAQGARLSLPGFVQGVESFTELHACTGLTSADLKEDGDKKLETALDEIHTLFPLARGTAILNQSAMSLTDTNAKGIARTKMKQSGKLTIALPCGDPPTHLTEIAASFKAAVRSRALARNTSRDIAISFHKRAVGLVWIVSKLLSDIGTQSCPQVHRIIDERHRTDSAMPADDRFCQGTRRLGCPCT